MWRLPLLVVPFILLAGPVSAAAQSVPTALVRGAWHHVVEDASTFAVLHPDSVIGGTAQDATLPLQVICEDGDDVHILVTGSAPRITDSGRGVRADYSAWTIHFSDGTTWRNDPMAVHPGGIPGTAAMQPTGVEEEMTQHLLASRWFRIEYVTSGGRSIAAHYTLPPDTEPQLGEVFYACGNALPVVARDGGGGGVGEVLPF